EARGVAVAARAGDRGLDREPRIEIELTAQLDLGPGHRVFFDAGDLVRGQGEAEWQRDFEGGVDARSGQPGFDLVGRQVSRARDAHRERWIAESHFGWQRFALVGRERRAGS